MESTFDNYFAFGLLYIFQLLNLVAGTKDSQRGKRKVQPRQDEQDDVPVAGTSGACVAGFDPGRGVTRIEMVQEVAAYWRGNGER